ncbi:hypothetical protein [Paenibacillus sp. GXUN7292]|uniref:hypothetical protein n=1 Tax=Paenibacillus sp. GXUN7292 TaxID=3422499 RepID=UPI003D7E1E93
MMAKRISNILQDQRGGVHILVFSLLAIISLTFIWMMALNFMLQSSSMNKSKLALDQATHAAAMEINRQQAARGVLVWNSTQGRDHFYRYLRLNMKLDSLNKPLPESFLNHDPIVHVLEGVTAASYPSQISRSITLYAGTRDQITRNVTVTIYGPSVLAIVEVRQGLMGKRRTEPILISSVSSIRFR